MFMHFDFCDGSNPYIATAPRTFWKMLNNYDVEQVGPYSFRVNKPRPEHKCNYEYGKALLRDFAIEWQYNFSELDYSYGEMAIYNDFFATFGKRYGLLREFRENGIC